MLGTEEFLHASEENEIRKPANLQQTFKYTWSPRETNSQPSFSEYVSFLGSSATMRN